LQVTEISSITLKNIPEDLHLAYKSRAKRQGRSLQAEILFTLSQSADETIDEAMLQVDDVAGSIKPAKSAASLDEMEHAVDAMLRREWKRKG